MMIAPRRTPLWIPLIPILLLAFALRSYTISSQSFWVDEVLTWDFAHEWPNMATIEAPQMLYVSVVALWIKLIPDELGARLPSLLADMVSMALIYQLGKRLDQPRSGIIAAALWSVSANGVYFSQEARSYAFVIASCLMTLWSMLLAERGIRWAGALFVISAALSVGFHLVAMLWVLTLASFLYLRKLLTSRGVSWRLLITMVVACGIMVATIRLIGMSGNYNWLAGLPTIGVFDALILYINSGLSIPLFSGWFYYLPLLICLGIGVVGLGGIREAVRGDGKWSGGWAVLLLVTLSLIPPIALIIASYIYKPLWVTRYLLPSMVCLIILPGIALSRLQSDWVRYAGIILLLVTGTAQIRNMYHARPEWKELTGYIADQAVQGDVIAVCPGWQRHPMEHYLARSDLMLMEFSENNDIEKLTPIFGEDQTLFVIDGGCETEITGRIEMGGGEADESIKFNMLHLLVFR